MCRSSTSPNILVASTQMAGPHDNTRKRGPQLILVFTLRLRQSSVGVVIRNGPHCQEGKACLNYLLGAAIQEICVVADRVQTFIACKEARILVFFLPCESFFHRGCPLAEYWLLALGQGCFRRYRPTADNSTYHRQSTNSSHKGTGVVSKATTLSGKLILMRAPIRRRSQFLIVGKTRCHAFVRDSL